MFEGEERWSRNAGSGIGLSNYKNIFRDGTLCGNWQEDQYGRELRDTTNDAQRLDMYHTTTMRDFERQPMDGLERGSSGVESLPAEMLFGHGQMSYGETRASNAGAGMAEIHYTKPTWEKRPAHSMAWVGEKDNDLTMPAISDPRRHLLAEKRLIWEHQVNCDVHGTSLSRDHYKDPKEQPLMHFKTEARKPRANFLGKTLGSSHLHIGLRK